MTRVASLLLPEDPEDASFRSERGLDRLASFSDAVVAIAITLVILPLIDLAGDSDASAVQLFREDGYRFAAAAVSFVLIGSIWREHHDAYERASTDSRRLVSINLIWLAAVVFLPIPTALLFVPRAGTEDEQLVAAIYAATLAAASIAMRLSEWEIRRHCSSGSPVKVKRWRLASQWASAVLLAVASVLAFSGLGTRALLILLFTVPLQWVSAWTARRRATRGALRTLLPPRTPPRS